jgi:hypothetical protein
MHAVLLELAGERSWLSHVRFLLGVASWTRPARHMQCDKAGSRIPVLAERRFSRNSEDRLGFEWE